jgi:Flp pilus assembly protein TadD
MTRLAKKGWALGVAGLLLTQAGCQMLSKISPSAAPSAPVTPLASSASEDAGELPNTQVVRASLILAQKLEKSNNEAAAFEQYERVLDQDPNNVQAMRRMAVLYDNRCEFSKAEELYRKLAKELPRDASLYNDWGYSYYMRCKFDEAEKKLRRAVELDPNNLLARCNLGLTLGQMGRLEDAKKAFRDAKLSDAEVHQNLAFVHLCRSEKGKNTLGEARREAELARELDPYCQQAKLMLAQLDNPNPGKPPAEMTAERSAPARDASDGRPPSKPSPVVRASATVKAPAPGEPGAVQPVLHRSPNGTAWVAPQYPKPAEPPPIPLPVSDPKAAGTEGTVTFDD